MCWPPHVPTTPVFRWQIPFLVPTPIRLGTDPCILELTQGESGASLPLINLISSPSD